MDLSCNEPMRADRELGPANRAKKTPPDVETEVQGDAESEPHLRPQPQSSAPIPPRPPPGLNELTQTLGQFSFSHIPSMPTPADQEALIRDFRALETIVSQAVAEQQRQQQQAQAQAQIQRQQQEFGHRQHDEHQRPQLQFQQRPPQNFMPRPPPDLYQMQLQQQRQQLEAQQRQQGELQQCQQLFGLQQRQPFDLQQCKQTELQQIQQQELLKKQQAIQREQAAALLLQQLHAGLASSRSLAASNPSNSVSSLAPSSSLSGPSSIASLPTPIVNGSSSFLPAMWGQQTPDFNVLATQRQQELNYLSRMSQMHVLEQQSSQAQQVHSSNSLTSILQSFQNSQPQPIQSMPAVSQFPSTPSSLWSQLNASQLRAQNDLSQLNVSPLLASQVEELKRQQQQSDFLAIYEALMKNGQLNQLPQPQQQPQLQPQQRPQLQAQPQPQMHSQPQVQSLQQQSSLLQLSHTTAVLPKAMPPQPVTLSQPGPSSSVASSSKMFYNNLVPNPLESLFQRAQNPGYWLQSTPPAVISSAVSSAVPRTTVATTSRSSMPSHHPVVPVTQVPVMFSQTGHPLISTAPAPVLASVPAPAPITTVVNAAAVKRSDISILRPPVRPPPPPQPFPSPVQHRPVVRPSAPMHQSLKEVRPVPPAALAAAAPMTCTTSTVGPRMTVVPIDTGRPHSTSKSRVKTITPVKVAQKPVAPRSVQLNRIPSTVIPVLVPPRKEPPAKEPSRKESPQKEPSKEIRPTELVPIVPKMPGPSTSAVKIPTPIPTPAPPPISVPPPTVTETLPEPASSVAEEPAPPASPLIIVDDEPESTSPVQAAEPAPPEPVKEVVYVERPMDIHDEIPGTHRKKGFVPIPKNPEVDEVMPRVIDITTEKDFLFACQDLPGIIAFLRKGFRIRVLMQAPFTEAAAKAIRRLQKKLPKEIIVIEGDGGIELVHIHSGITSLEEFVNQVRELRRGEPRRTSWLYTPNMFAMLSNRIDALGRAAAAAAAGQGSSISAASAASIAPGTVEETVRKNKRKQKFDKSNPEEVTVIGTVNRTAESNVPTSSARSASQEVVEMLESPEVVLPPAAKKRAISNHVEVDDDDEELIVVDDDEPPGSSTEKTVVTEEASLSPSVEIAAYMQANFDERERLQLAASKKKIDVNDESFRKYATVHVAPLKRQIRNLPANEFFKRLQRHKMKPLKLNQWPPRAQSLTNLRANDTGKFMFGPRFCNSDNLSWVFDKENRSTGVLKAKSIEVIKGIPIPRLAPEKSTLVDLFLIKVDRYAQAFGVADLEQMANRLRTQKPKKGKMRLVSGASALPDYTKLLGTSVELERITKALQKSNWFNFDPHAFLAKNMPNSEEARRQESAKELDHASAVQHFMSLVAFFEFDPELFAKYTKWIIKYHDENSREHPQFRKNMALWAVFKEKVVMMMKFLEMKTPEARIQDLLRKAFRLVDIHEFATTEDDPNQPNASECNDDEVQVVAEKEQEVRIVKVVELIESAAATGEAKKEIEQFLSNWRRRRYFNSEDDLFPEEESNSKPLLASLREKGRRKGAYKMPKLKWHLDRHGLAYAVELDGQKMVQLCPLRKMYYNRKDGIALPRPYAVVDSSHEIFKPRRVTEDHFGTLESPYQKRIGLDYLEETFYSMFTRSVKLTEKLHEMCAWNMKTHFPIVSEVMNKVVEQLGKRTSDDPSNARLFELFFILTGSKWARSLLAELQHNEDPISEGIAELKASELAETVYSHFQYWLEFFLNGGADRDEVFPEYRELQIWGEGYPCKEMEEDLRKDNRPSRQMLLVDGDMERFKDIERDEQDEEPDPPLLVRLNPQQRMERKQRKRREKRAAARAKARGKVDKTPNVAVLDVDKGKKRKFPMWMYSDWMGGDSDSELDADNEPQKTPKKKTSRSARNNKSQNQEYMRQRLVRRYKMQDMEAHVRALYDTARIMRKAEHTEARKARLRAILHSFAHATENYQKELPTWMDKMFKMGQDMLTSEAVQIRQGVVPPRAQAELLREQQNGTNGEGSSAAGSSEPTAGSSATSNSGSLAPNATASRQQPQPQQQRAEVNHSEEDDDEVIDLTEEEPGTSSSSAAGSSVSSAATEKNPNVDLNSAGSQQKLTPLMEKLIEASQEIRKDFNVATLATEPTVEMTPEEQARHNDAVMDDLDSQICAAMECDQDYLFENLADDIEDDLADILHKSYVYTYQTLWLVNRVKEINHRLLAFACPSQLHDAVVEMIFKANNKKPAKPPSQDLGDVEVDVSEPTSNMEKRRMMKRTRRQRRRACMRAQSSDSTTPRRPVMIYPSAFVSAERRKALERRRQRIAKEIVEVATAIRGDPTVAPHASEPLSRSSQTIPQNVSNSAPVDDVVSAIPADLVASAIPAEVSMRINDVTCHSFKNRSSSKRERAANRRRIAALIGRQQTIPEHGEHRAVNLALDSPAASRSTSPVKTGPCTSPLVVGGLKRDEIDMIVLDRQRDADASAVPEGAPIVHIVQDHSAIDNDGIEEVMDDEPMHPVPTGRTKVRPKAKALQAAARMLGSQKVVKAPRNVPQPPAQPISVHRPLREPESGKLDKRPSPQYLNQIVPCLFDPSIGTKLRALREKGLSARISAIVSPSEFPAIGSHMVEQVIVTRGVRNQMTYAMATSVPTGLNPMPRFPLPRTINNVEVVPGPVRYQKESESSTASVESGSDNLTPEPSETNYQRVEYDGIVALTPPYCMSQCRPVGTTSASAQATVTPPMSSAAATSSAASATSVSVDKAATEMLDALRDLGASATRCTQTSPSAPPAEVSTVDAEVPNLSDLVTMVIEALIKRVRLPSDETPPPVAPDGKTLKDLDEAYIEELKHDNESPPLLIHMLHHRFKELHNSTEPPMDLALSIKRFFEAHGAQQAAAARRLKNRRNRAAVNANDKPKGQKKKRKIVRNPVESNTEGNAEKSVKKTIVKRKNKPKAARKAKTSSAGAGDASAPLVSAGLKLRARPPPTPAPPPDLTTTPVPEVGPVQTNVAPPARPQTLKLHHCCHKHRHRHDKVPTAEKPKTVDVVQSSSSEARKEPVVPSVVESGAVDKPPTPKNKKLNQLRVEFAIAPPPSPLSGAIPPSSDAAVAPNQLAELLEQKLELSKEMPTSELELEVSVPQPPVSSQTATGERFKKSSAKQPESDTAPALASTPAPAHPILPLAPAESAKQPKAPPASQQASNPVASVDMAPKVTKAAKKTVGRKAKTAKPVRMSSESPSPEPVPVRNSPKKPARRGRKPKATRARKPAPVKKPVIKKPVRKAPKPTVMLFEDSPSPTEMLPWSGSSESDSDDSDSSLEPSEDLDIEEAQTKSKSTSPSLSPEPVDHPVPQEKRVSPEQESDRVDQTASEIVSAPVQTLQPQAELPPASIERQNSSNSLIEDLPALILEEQSVDLVVQPTDGDVEDEFAEEEIPYPNNDKDEPKFTDELALLKDGEEEKLALTPTSRNSSVSTSPKKKKPRRYDNKRKWSTKKHRKAPLPAIPRDPSKPRKERVKHKWRRTPSHTPSPPPPSPPLPPKRNRIQRQDIAIVYDTPKRRKPSQTKSDSEKRETGKKTSPKDKKAAPARQSKSQSRSRTASKAEPVEKSPIKKTPATKRRSSSTSTTSPAKKRSQSRK